MNGSLRSTGQRALVLDGDSRAALAIVRSLGRRQVRVIVASEERASLAGRSKWCADTLTYPSPCAEPRLFEGWLISVLADMPDAVLFVSSDVTASIAGRCRNRLPRPAQGLLPPQRSLEIALDKSATLDLALKLGVPIPRSIRITRGQAVDDGGLTLSYPLAIKAAQSDLPRRYATVYARSAAELHALVDEVLRESEAALVQEVIRGEGTAIFALFDSGSPLVTFAHRRLIEKPPWGGVSALCCSVEPPPDALDAALAMLKELNWHGPAMVEFKRDAKGVPYLMEINPRFWGSVQLAVRSGVDFPYLAMQLALGEAIEPATARPAANRWVLGEIDSLITALLNGVPGRSRLRELASHLRGLRYGPCFEVERLTDPKPALHEYAAWLRTSAGRFVARWKGGVARWGKLSLPEA